MSHHVWTDEQKNFIINNAHRLKDAEISVSLGNLFNFFPSINAVAKIRVSLGLKKTGGRGVVKLRSVIPPGSAFGLHIKAG